MAGWLRTRRLSGHCHPCGSRGVSCTRRVGCVWWAGLYRARMRRLWKRALQPVQPIRPGFWNRMAICTWRELGGCAWCSRAGLAQRFRSTAATPGRMKSGRTTAAREPSVRNRTTETPPVKPHTHVTPSAACSVSGLSQRHLAAAESQGSGLPLAAMGLWRSGPSRCLGREWLLWS